MIDLPDIIAKRLHDAGFADAKVQPIARIKDGGICVRRVPSTTTGRAFDGNRNIDYLVQVVVARESEYDCIEEIEQVATIIPHTDLASENGSYTLTSCDIYTDPAELELTGYPYVWTVRFKALLTTTSEGRI
jgi:hypothetical protein